MRPFFALLAVFLFFCAIALLDSWSRAQNEADVSGAFGDPLPGLTEGQEREFERGREVFRRRFRRQEGLGPHFNATSCNSCHEDPAPGGSSQRYRDFLLVGSSQPDGTVAKVFPDCTEENRSTQRTECCLPSLVLPHYGPKGTISDPVAATVEHPPIPPGADVVARRNAPPIFGIGLFRLISDKEILSRADPDDDDGDGISGRANIISKEDGAVGRFGYKCQTASIEAFNRGALMNQMGITSDSTELVDPLGASLLNRVFGVKSAYAQVAEPKDRIRDYDAVPDPEISRSDLLALIFFQENLAAPRRGEITPAVLRGEEVFADAGCAGCHTASLETDLGLIHPYSDLLLHDMGADLADAIVMDDAGGSEFRTQPLWGLCQHAPFLHDGRADTLEQAILLHGGEAEAARTRYQELSSGDRADLHRFLESL